MSRWPCRLGIGGAVATAGLSRRIRPDPRVCVAVPALCHRGLQIYSLIFLLQAASAELTPAFQATIPDVQRDERDYTNAQSLMRLAEDLEQLLSPMLAAALLTVVSFLTLFGGTVAGFGVSAVLVVSVRLPARSQTAAGALQLWPATDPSQV